MHFSRVQPRLANTHRLDPDYYHPQYLVDEIKLKEFGSEPLGKAGKMFAGPFGSKLPSSLYLDEGVPLFRVGNVGSMEVELSGMAYLAPQVHAELSTSEVRAGDLLIVKASVGEKICKVPETIPRANITQHIIALRANGSVDTDYVSAFLFGGYGRRQLIRRSLGSIIQYLGVGDARTVLIPKMHADVQAYIGEKVRQAERLRERARQAGENFRAAIEQQYPDIFGPVLETSRHSRTQQHDLNSTLNPGAYNPERLRIRKYLLEHGGRVLRTIAGIETPTASSYAPEDTYIGLDAISSSSSMLSPSSIADAGVAGTVRVLREGPVISKLRPYLNKASYIPRELAGVLGSTELLCLKPRDEAAGWFLYGALKLESTVRQLNPIATGATHPRVTRDDVLDLVLPWHEDYEQLGRELALAQQGYFGSERLTVAAKLLVEGLIEGKLTEAELKMTQESLERGEHELDRAILSRLTRKGIDVAGEPPLFPDTDALYEAIDQVMGESQRVEMTSAE
jgi:type I restriction enzyme, S subunit